MEALPLLEVELRLRVPDLLAPAPSWARPAPRGRYRAPACLGQAWQRSGIGCHVGLLG